MICWAVEAQVLQIRDEVRDGALVYALTLTEDVELDDKHQRNQHIIISNTLTLIREDLTKLCALVIQIELVANPFCLESNAILDVPNTLSTQVTLSNISKSLALG